MEPNSFNESAQSSVPLHIHKTWKIFAIVAVITGIILLGFFISNKQKLSAVKGDFVVFQQKLSELSPEMSAAVLKAVETKESVSITNKSQSVGDFTQVDISGNGGPSTGYIYHCNGHSASALALCAEICEEVGGDWGTIYGDGMCEITDSTSVNLNVINNQPQFGFTFSNANQIKIMQTLLNDTGFYSGAIDGKMGGITKSALQKWQIKNELVSTGIVNFVTQATLNTILSTQFKK